MRSAILFGLIALGSVAVGVPSARAHDYAPVPCDARPGYYSSPSYYPSHGSYYSGYSAPYYSDYHHDQHASVYYAPRVHFDLSVGGGHGYFRSYGHDYGGRHSYGYSGGHTYSGHSSYTDGGGHRGYYIDRHHRH